MGCERVNGWPENEGEFTDVFVGVWIHRVLWLWHALVALKTRPPFIVDKHIAEHALPTLCWYDNANIVLEPFL